MSEKGFNPKDLEDICSRPRTKFKMKKADYKELGRNVLLGSVDVVIGSVSAAFIGAGVLSALSNRSTITDDLYENNSNDGWQNGPQGYGYYMNGIKNKD